MPASAPIDFSVTRVSPRGDLYGARDEQQSRESITALIEYSNVRRRSSDERFHPRSPARHAARRGARPMVLPSADLRPRRRAQGSLFVR